MRRRRMPAARTTSTDRARPASGCFELRGAASWLALTAAPADTVVWATPRDRPARRRPTRHRGRRTSDAQRRAGHPGDLCDEKPAAPRAALRRRGHRRSARACSSCAFPVETLASPWLFLLLLALSSITSVFKVNLPLARSGSTMSVSYAVDFASLLLLGPERDDGRGGGERLQPVHVPHQGTQSRIIARSSAWRAWS